MDLSSLTDCFGDIFDVDRCKNIAGVDCIGIQTFEN